MNPTNVPKQTLYKTAYSPAMKTYVKINRALKAVDGKWVYICTWQDKDQSANCRSFTESELENFVL